MVVQVKADQDFKKLMTWQVLMQNRLEKLSAKVDRQADMQAALDARGDKLVIGIGELIRARRFQGFPQ